MMTITTPAEANATFRQLFDAGEGYGPGLQSNGMRQSIEATVDDMLDEPAARLRSDLGGDGLTVVQSGDGNLVGLRDDAKEGAWAIVLGVPAFDRKDWQPQDGADL